jgi:phage-related minor tail protein
VLIPKLEPLIVKFTEMVSAARPMIELQVTKWVEDFSNALPNLIEGARSFAQDLGVLVDGVRWLGETFGYARVAAVAAGVYLAGPLIGALLNVTTAFGALGISVAATAVRLTWLSFASVAAAIGNFVTALQAGYGVMAAFNLVLAANPIGLVITAVGALAAAAFLIYQNWEPIAKFFTDLWDGIVAKVRKSIDALIGILPDFIKRQLGFSVNVATPGAAAASGPQLGPPIAGGTGGAIGQPFSGELVVRLEGAPPGTRVERLTTNQAGLDVGVDLGATMVSP